MTNYEKAQALLNVAQLGARVSYGNIDIDKMMVFDRSNRHRYNFPINKWEYAQ